MDYQKAAGNIRRELENYLTKNNIRTLVIGLSGGIDSTICAVLAKPVCDKLNIRLIGRSLSIQTNKADEIKRSINAGNAFCSDFNEIDLSVLFLMMKANLENEIFSDETILDKKIRIGNIKARVRMIYLYNLAQKCKGLVLSTDNYTEFLLGFWTLHGDVGDYGMIQSLWKTEVYGLSKWIVDNELTDPDHKEALQACIDAVPTDGLGITNSDLDQLKAKTYEEVDNILKNFLADGSNSDHAVIKRHLRSEFKRNNPFNIDRDLILK